MLAISCDSKFSHLAWYRTPRNKGGIAGVEIPLLADFNKDVACDYGVLNEAAGFPLRSLFLIDPKGIVKYSLVHDGAIGRNTEEVLRVLDALQHGARTGEVCPVNWSKGKKAINPKEPASYFEGV